jgi:hypothetical protein
MTGEGGPIMNEKNKNPRFVFDAYSINRFLMPGTDYDFNELGQVLVLVGLALVTLCEIFLI